jgi:hypothetical protein
VAAIPPLVEHLDALKLRLGEIPRSGAAISFRPNDATRAAMARTLGLVALPAFSADLQLAPWLDGAELRGQWTGVVMQTCGVSLDDFDTPLSGQFTVQMLPPDSPNAPSPEAEVDLDPNAPDPPDVLETDRIDLGAYVIEHLGLEVDPFPRKPGAVFEPPETAAVISPFASLRDLKS